MPFRFVDMDVNSASTLRGWELLCVAVTAFAPTKNFEEYLLHYVELNCNSSVLGEMGCNTKLMAWTVAIGA